MHEEVLPMSFDSDLAVEVTALSKCYRLFDKPSDRLKQSLPWFRKPLYQEFWALDEVSLSLRKGHTLGVIGRNGSGKSTLLQLICGTLTPTKGVINVSGRIGALLELGSGFNPEFTGLENVLLNAAILGLSSAEVESKLDDILAFADIGDFINQPVKLYSSGMVVRLAFAVQAHVDPSILIVDEALAVGDELFQKKCFARLENLKHQGTSILLVSHSCSQINQHCDEVLLLNKGKSKLYGPPHYVTAIYQRLLQVPDHKWEDILREDSSQRQDTSLSPFVEEQSLSKDLDVSTGDKFIHESWFDPSLVSSSRISYPADDAEIASIVVNDINGDRINTFPQGNSFDIVITVTANRNFEAVRLGCFVANASGSRVTGQSYPKKLGEVFSLRAGESKSITLGFIGGLWPGLYFIGAGLCDINSSGKFLHRLIDDYVIRIADIYHSQPIGDTDLGRILS